MSPIVESIVLSLGTGLVVLALGLVVNRIPRPVAVLMALGIGLLVFVLWPRAALVEVPDLADLSRDEAELRLSSAKLVAAPQPQQAPNTPVEHVVPMSQNPLPGTKVRRGTLVRYSISTPTSVDQREDHPSSPSPRGSISIFSPKDGGEVVPKRGADNLFRFDVEGTIEAVDLTKSLLLLWVQPVEPLSDQPGWYLQRVPNGIRSIAGTNWRGVCQIGNQQWPPHAGDIVDVAASVVPGEEAARLLARQGPLTVIVLPGLASPVARLRVRIQ
ncbi:MAG: PASTA domain-containing protein [Acidobacteriota bacterium]|nr:PASTA domain-containing protein [Acidobacteriota bacterium]